MTERARDVTGNSKHSPEIPDRGWTSDNPGLPLEALRGKNSQRRR